MVYWYFGRYNGEEIIFPKIEVESTEFFSRNKLEEIMEIQEIEQELEKHKGRRNNFSLKMYKICRRVWEGEFSEKIQLTNNKQIRNLNVQMS